MSALANGDRVRMDARRRGIFDPSPEFMESLGEGTVVATTDAEASGPLMEGWYVEVEWDGPAPRAARFPSIQSLVKV